jgi:transposase
VTETLKPPPKKLGITHWSSQLLADRLKVSATSIQRAWRSYGIKPWKAESFRFSTDPELVGKVTDICGLYLGTNEDIPANAIVLSVDEKSQIQALDRTVPILPMQEGRIERRSHDYYRHGTTTLFAALEIATGQVTAALKPKHRHQEFLAFLRQIERTYRHAVDPETGEPVELHLVMDNYAAHKHKKVRDWLEQNPRFKVHFTPTHASWMNLVEIWFGLVERQAVRRGIFKSVKDLNGKLRAYIEGWNERAHPFVWTKTAEEILKKANRSTTSNPRH